MNIISISTHKDKIKSKQIELNEVEITNMYDREFKGVAIKILTGLNKRMKDLSETLNKR